MFFNLQIVLKLGEEKTTPLPLYVVCGISALKLFRPLAGKTIEIPKIPNTFMTHGINALLDLRWRKFKMPQHPSWLVPALTTADLLGNHNYFRCGYPACSSWETHSGNRCIQGSQRSLLTSSDCPFSTKQK